MEKSTMFLHSLLVLLVAIQVTFACNCKPLTLLESMCSTTTVVLARVSEGKPDNLRGTPYTKYTLEVQRRFRVEENKLSLDDNRRSYLLFPRDVSDCGGMLNEGDDYVFVGTVNSKGNLISSRCFYFAPYVYITWDSHSMKILIGEEDCKDIC
ncbi:hypothetical protein CHS0354_019479 [Potamilus streckersoni]|uniref:NTR domain-containing protein n=1 Tax=Potamilus streckersoni TaxID=2493646 RepID=A0AAE0SHV8_9BIVA|nr:hypothetical protein CHS0354_019479 [Potamilus streckersoni]